MTGFSFGVIGPSLGGVRLIGVVFFFDGVRVFGAGRGLASASRARCSWSRADVWRVLTFRSHGIVQYFWLAVLLMKMDSHSGHVPRGRAASAACLSARFFARWLA